MHLESKTSLVLKLKSLIFLWKKLKQMFGNYSYQNGSKISKMGAKITQNPKKQPKTFKKRPIHWNNAFLQQKEVYKHVNRYLIIQIFSEVFSETNLKPQAAEMLLFEKFFMFKFHVWHSNLKVFVLFLVLLKKLCGKLFLFLESSKLDSRTSVVVWTTNIRNAILWIIYSFNGYIL